jgi:hypothetical protein
LRAVGTLAEYALEAKAILNQPLLLKSRLYTNKRKPSAKGSGR